MILMIYDLICRDDAINCRSIGHNALTKYNHCQIPTDQGKSEVEGF